MSKYLFNFQNKSKLLVVLILFFAVSSIVAQSKTDNYSFFKLYVTNDKNEVLLVKWNGQWEIAGSRFNDPVSVKKFINDMAYGMGITIEKPKLRGMYTQRWKNANYLTLMQYYQAKYVRGTLKIPEDCTDIGWFSYEDALRLIPYKNMITMMRLMKEYPDQLIGAAFERYKDQNNQTQFITLEDWYLF